MNDTNLVNVLLEQLNQLRQAAPVARNTWNAWHLIAAGAGMFIVHGYHVLKDVGGLRVIWRNIVGSAPNPLPQNPPVNPPAQTKTQP